jgi:hypothetical protein
MCMYIYSLRQYLCYIHIMYVFMFMCIKVRKATILSKIEERITTSVEREQFAKNNIRIDLGWYLQILENAYVLNIIYR